MASNIEQANTWPSGPNVVSESAIVMEASTGLILYEKNIHDKHYPASITKILTTLLAIENSSLGEVVTFSRDSVYKVDADSSRLWIDVGEQLTMQQCYYAILLESANDVSYATAEHVGNGNIDTFIQMMNNRATEIGALNSSFANPHGLHDDNHYTTAYDMALITREAMKNETFRKVFGTRTYQIPPTNKQDEIRYLRNHHRFILKQDYLYDGAIGGKTGFTSKSRFTLVSVAKRGDLELITVVMRVDSNANQYKDTQKLFDYGYDNFSIYPVGQLDNASKVQESPFFTKYNDLLYGSDAIQVDPNGYVILPNEASLDDAQKEVVFYSLEERPKENIVGKISYSYNGKYVGGADILYNNNHKLAIQLEDIVTPSPSNHEEVPDNSQAQNASSKLTGKKTSNDNQSMKPIIVAVIIAFIVIVIAFYYFIVERPRLKRRKAYYKKRANRRSYRDNDYLDL